ncbi:MAG: hypothetical protein VX701_04410 [Chloroflexota bacterium]|nr:hypothetical protein [Chloroflexota bacterium]
METTLNYNPVLQCLNGSRYKAPVPDTLDLAGRAAKSVNALTSAWNPVEGFALNFIADFSSKSPVLYPNNHTDAFLNIPPKFIEALILTRLASGSDLNINIDKEVIQTQLNLIGDDGLTYSPTNILTQFNDSNGHYSEIWSEGRLLIALAMLIQVEKNPIWETIALKKIDRIMSLTKQQDDFLYLWRGRYWNGDIPPVHHSEPKGNLQNGSLLDRYSNPAMSIIYSVGATGYGASLIYRITGYEPALRLSQGLARWALRRVFTNPDGRWNIYHFHHSLFAIMAMCQYGYTNSDDEVLDRVHACYNWARLMGDPLIGYYTEWMPGSDLYLSSGQGNSVETCEVADMIFLGLYMTKTGLGDYWDDVDRWTRNMFAESQFLDSGFHDNIPDSYLHNDAVHRPYQDTSLILEKSVGSFWGWMRANDGLKIDYQSTPPKLIKTSIMHCCTANGARTLYFIWDSIVTENSGEIRVNLLLNRASPWVDINSYLPVKGKVTLQIKQPNKFAVRIPNWCNIADVRLEVNSEPHNFDIDGRYVKIGKLSPGCIVTLNLPVQEHTTHRVIGEIPYKLTTRGANVTSIEPRGVGYPLFQNQPTGFDKISERFVPDIRSIDW